MKNSVLLFIVLLLSVNSFAKPRISFHQNTLERNFYPKQIRLDPNTTDTWIQNTGIFNQDLRTNNTPGLMWPRGSNRFSIFTTGLILGAKVNDTIRIASCTYSGEYYPGYCNNGVPDSNSNFRLYKINAGEGPSSFDWANWYRMVPYGAPYVDVNHNGVYDNNIDTPGVRNAAQTVFICMTDGFPGSHNYYEGFPGGTKPLFAEMHLTVWGYDIASYTNLQFFKIDIINKGIYPWDSTFTALFCDPDLGYTEDDFIGCDTTLRLGYCYNSDNMDGTGNPPSYGTNPPTVGFIMFKGMKISGSNPVDLGMTSFTYTTNVSSGDISCERDPDSAAQTYMLLKGRKKDGSYWIHPQTKQRTKLLYTGNVETGQGWTEFGYNGDVNKARVRNCLNGDTITTYPSAPGDRRFLMGSGASNLVINPGGYQSLAFSEMEIRGSNYRNAVTALSQLAVVAKTFYNTSIGIQSISNEVASSFTLYQNYPNPFNPVTKIRFDVAENGKWNSENGMVTLKVYDILGKEVATLVNERLQSGTYEATWDASGFGSGVFFYRLAYGNNVIETRKMVLLK